MSLLSVVAFAREDGARADKYLGKGDRLRLDLPDGRVTLSFRGTSASGTAFLHLEYERIRQGLCTFERPARSLGAATGAS